MFKTATITEKTIYKEFRIHHDFDSHRSLRYINIIPRRLTLELQCHSYSWSNVRRNVIHAVAAKTVF